MRIRFKTIDGIAWTLLLLGFAIELYGQYIESTVHRGMPSTFARESDAPIQTQAEYDRRCATAGFLKKAGVGVTLSGPAFWMIVTWVRRSLRPARTLTGQS